MGLDIVDLIHRIEKHFAIRIPNSEAEQISTVADVHQTVMHHLPTGTNPSEVYDTLHGIIADHTGVPLHHIQPQSSLTDDLGMD